MAFVDWSSLPFDLINRIADCFLATNDVDYYMDFRAVCRSWRSAADDPRNSPDPRFHPRRWVNIDNTSSCDNTLLLVNTATGRFLHKELPLLCSYCVATDGLLLLMGSAMDSPLSVLNPLTGYLIRFTVPLPDIKTLDTATLVSAGSSPTLLLLCHSYREVYRADLDSECYGVYEDSFCTCPFLWLAVRGIYGNGDWDRSVEPFAPAVAGKMCSLLMMFNVDPPELSDDDGDTVMSEEEAIWKFWIGYGNRGFLLKSAAGELLIIVKLDYHMKVFKMDTGRNVLETVENIGNRAIFLGDCCRCMSVDADKFPSVEANCIYYTNRLDFPSEIHAYDIMKNKVERRISKDVCCDSPPYTITQLLCSFILE